MTTLFIAILISFGYINSADDYTNASVEQQQEYQSIVIDDVIEL